MLSRALAIGSLCAFACAADEYRDAALKRAEDSVKAATEKASKDPSRPVYHFMPPAQWMNDPNGTIYHNGYYHVFYQHNPYADTWGHMHWGHARSKDLVHWERLPIALWPSEDKGEAHVFSGCAAINGDGVPMLFYTSVSTAEKKRPNEQWAAIGDADLIKWEKHPNNPMLDAKLLPFEIGPDWRDPFIFSVKERTFLVCGADTKEEAIIPIFEAETPQLDKWEYKGILYHQPKSSVQFFECPNFFQLDGKWVLIFSPYKPPRYMIGTFNLNDFTFAQEIEGTLDYGTFYASNTLQSDHPQVRANGGAPTATTPAIISRPTFLVGWIRGFNEGLGWNGCMSIPRLLSIGEDGYLCQTPAESMKKLEKPNTLRAASPGIRLTANSSTKYQIATGFSDFESGSMTLTPKTKGLPPIVLRIAEDGVTLDNVLMPWNDKRELRYVKVEAYIDKTVLEIAAIPYVKGASGQLGTINISKVIAFSPDGYDVDSENLGHAFDELTSIWSK